MFGMTHANQYSMPSQIQLDGLLFSHDGLVLKVMNEVLGTFAIHAEVCQDLEPAVSAVTHRRLDAIIVDWEDAESPTRIVRSARKSSPNSNSTIVALVNPGSEAHALLVGANFMIHKPATVEQAGRCMRAAYGTMLQNRRRAARVPVSIPVTAKVAQLGIVSARVIDLSIGGLALKCDRPLPIDSEVMLHFPLPGSSLSIHVSGTIVNVNTGERAGLRFSFVPEKDQETLEHWLASEFAKLERAELPS
jgi:hypothetical protein